MRQLRWWGCAVLLLALVGMSAAEGEVDPATAGEAIRQRLLAAYQSAPEIRHDMVWTRKGRAPEKLVSRAFREGDRFGMTVEEAGRPDEPLAFAAGTSRIALIQAGGETKILPGIAYLNEQAVPYRKGFELLYGLWDRVVPSPPPFEAGFRFGSQERLLGKHALGTETTRVPDDGGLTIDVGLTATGRPVWLGEDVWDAAKEPPRTEAGIVRLVLPGGVLRLRISDGMPEEVLTGEARDGIEIRGRRMEPTRSLEHWRRAVDDACRPLREDHIAAEFTGLMQSVAPVFLAVLLRDDEHLGYRWDRLWAALTLLASIDVEQSRLLLHAIPPECEGEEDGETLAEDDLAYSAATEVASRVWEELCEGHALTWPTDRATRFAQLVFAAYHHQLTWQLEATPIGMGAGRAGRSSQAEDLELFAFAEAATIRLNASQRIGMTIRNCGRRATGPLLVRCRLPARLVALTQTVIPVATLRPGESRRVEITVRCRGYGTHVVAIELLEAGGAKPLLEKTVTLRARKDETGDEE